jgi:transposase
VEVKKMPKLRIIKLTSKEKTELRNVRKKHPKAYMRERAAAILKISKGQSPHSVATKGLLKRRDPDTVYDWLDRYEAAGLEGLQIKAGRGRKPAFSP